MEEKPVIKVGDLTISNRLVLGVTLDNLEKGEETL